MASMGVIDILRQKLAVAVYIVNKENKILLVKGYMRGWEFPGGYVNIGESIKLAAIREVKEESGINIEINSLLGVEQSLADSTCVIILKGDIVSGKLTPSDESQDVGYFTYEEACRKMTNEAFKKRLVRCFNNQEIPFFIVK
jgi:8-oxo-dGTP diphosphatase